MQVAGRPCAVCDQPISGVREGGFCPKCTAPVHDRCSRVDPTNNDGCTECGVAHGVGRAVKEEHEKLLRSVGRVLARQDIIRGLLAAGGGIVAVVVLLLPLVVGIIFYTDLIYAAIFAAAGVGMLVRGLWRYSRRNPNDHTELID